MKITTTHPLHAVAEFVNAHEKIECVEFSIYRYTPRTLEDRREIVRTSPQFLPKIVNTLSRNLEPEEEIAFHSRVLMQGSVYHIPMIDLATEKLTTGATNELRRLAQEYSSQNVNLYASGRSYHVYAFTLLDHQDWVQFMGRLLLLNVPGEREIVDTRWVGHRLLAGYSSLRWTRNSGHYLKNPRLVEQGRRKLAQNLEPACA